MSPRRNAHRFQLATFAQELDWALDRFYARIERGRGMTERRTAIYFHERVVGIVRRRGGFPSRWIADDAHVIELLYAVLCAWGMDSNAARLTAYDQFKDAVLTIASSEPFRMVESHNLRDVDEAWRNRLSGLWRVLEGPGKITATGSILVASSKLLHHLLPDLFIPIDRSYTLEFLRHIESETYRISSGERMMPGFDGFYRAMMFFGHLARSHPNLERHLNRGPMSQSIPKLFDNALMSWWREP